MTKFQSLCRLSAPALAMGLAVPLASFPALADEKTQIEVTSPSAMKEWKSGVSRQLDRALRRTPERRTLVPDSGIVQIAFEVDDKGRPTNLRVKKNSANWSAARMARRAVKRIRTMAEAPITDVSEARFLARIVFADNRAQRDEMLRDIEKSERTRLASGAERDDLIVLGG